MSKNTLLSALINYVSANSSGNVVVAAPSSGYALDVTGTGRYTGDLTLANTSANNRLFINRASSSYTNGIFYQTNGTYDFLLGQNPLGTGTSDLSIYSYGTSSVVFSIAKSSGNVGIGTSSPAAGLDVNSAGTYVLSLNNTAQDTRMSFSVNGTQTFQFSSSASQINLYGATNIPMLLYTNGSERMRITSGGLLALGGTGASERFNITSGNQKFYTYQYSPGQYTYIGTEYAQGNGNNKAEIRFGIESDTYTFLSFATANGGGSINERMRITSGGKVLIGKTSDDGYPLQVNGTISISGTYGLSKVSTGAYMPMLLNGTLYYILIYA